MKVFLVVAAHIPFAWVMTWAMAYTYRKAQDYHATTFSMLFSVLRLMALPFFGWLASDSPIFYEPLVPIYICALALPLLGQLSGILTARWDTQDMS